MDLTKTLELFDRQLRRDVRPDGPGALVERVGDVVRQIGAGSDGWAGVAWSSLDTTTADRAIRDQVDWFTNLGREFEWKLYGYDGPPDLAQRLTDAGFVAEETETLMVAPVVELSTGVELPEGVNLLPVVDPDGVDLLVEVHNRAFGTDGARLRSRLLTQLDQGSDQFEMVLAMAGDQPVSSARMEFCSGTDFAGLWGGGTLPEWRGRGIYRALVAHRARLAAERGFRYLQVDASSESRPILQRLGFAALTTTTPYVFTP